MNWLVRVRVCSLNIQEAMRNATVMDSDGSAEYQKVKLTPSNWCVPYVCSFHTLTPSIRAWHAQEKAKGDDAPTVRTVEWYTWEIGRLEKLNRVLQAVSTVSASPFFSCRIKFIEVLLCSRPRLSSKVQKVVILSPFQTQALWMQKQRQRLRTT